MERGQQAIRLVSENSFPDDAWKQKAPAPAAMDGHDEVIRELDAIFDHIHGGRAARYYAMR